MEISKQILNKLVRREIVKTLQEVNQVAQPQQPQPQQSQQPQQNIQANQKQNQPTKPAQVAPEVIREMTKLLAGLKKANDPSFAKVDAWLKTVGVNINV